MEATKRGDYSSHYVTLYPLFALVTEQIKDYKGHDYLSKLLYKGLKGVMKINIKTQKKKTEKGETMMDKVLPAQQTLFNVSTDHKVGVLVITGAVDTKKSTSVQHQGGLRLSLNNNLNTHTWATTSKCYVN